MTFSTRPVSPLHGSSAALDRRGSVRAANNQIAASPSAASSIEAEVSSRAPILSVIRPTTQSPEWGDATVGKVSAPATAAL